jgi:hypothetical protein
MPVDWTAFERQLVTVAREEIARFAAAHRDEPFYAFLFDCNSQRDEEDVGFCVNTEDHYRKQLSRYRKQYPKHYATVEQRTAFRFSPGDWKYQGWAPVVTRPAVEPPARRERVDAVTAVPDVDAVMARVLEHVAIRVAHVPRHRDDLDMVAVGKHAAAAAELAVEATCDPHRPALDSKFYAASVDASLSGYFFFGRSSSTIRSA